MMFRRSKLFFFAAICLSGQMGVAQESTGGAGASSPGSTAPGGGASSSFGAPSTGSSTNPSPGNLANPFAPESQPGTTSPVPSFRTGGGATQTTDPASAGATSNFGTEQSGATTRAAPASFSVPGFYGRGAQQYTVGEGRLARPRFRFTGSLSQGYDDNVLQTPTHPQFIPDQKVQVLVSPGSPATTMTVTVPSGDPAVPDSEQTVEVPAQPAKFRYERLPGTPAPERVGSFVTRSSVGWDVQLASRRNLFTFDLNVGNSYYWDRPGKKSDYNGSLSLIYLRKLTGRAQFTAAINVSYQSQPNFSQINAPTTNNRGNYLTANLKGDLSYRLTPRFSSVTSVAYSGLTFGEKSESSGNYGETTFGTELRYLFSPRLTMLGELRYSSTTYKENSELDKNTYFLLIGGELRLTRRFAASLRIGEALQTYTESGGKSSAPYLEGTLDYRLARGTTIQWNARYGYENASTADSEVIVARTGLSLTHIFSPRLQASLALNLVRSQNTTTTEVAVPTTETATPTPTPSTTDPAAPTDPTATAATPEEVAPPETRSVTTETVQETIDATLGLNYTLSRRWSFNLSYTYTMAIGPVDTADYYRQQIFFGAEFQF